MFSSDLFKLLACHFPWQLTSQDLQTDYVSMSSWMLQFGELEDRFKLLVCGFPWHFDLWQDLQTMPLWEPEIDLRQILFQNECHSVFEAICQTRHFIFLIRTGQIAARKWQQNLGQVNIVTYKFDFEKHSHLQIRFWNSVIFHNSRTHLWHGEFELKPNKSHNANAPGILRHFSPSLSAIAPALSLSLAFSGAHPMATAPALLAPSTRRCPEKAPLTLVAGRRPTQRARRSKQ
jgi:hypothetical protein